MKRNWISSLVLLLVLAVPAASPGVVTVTSGSAVDATVPSGVCSAFNMLNVSTYNSAFSTAFVQLAVDPVGMLNRGTIYYPLGSANRDLLVFNGANLINFGPVGTVAVDAAGSPDAQNSQSGSFFDPYINRFVNAGRQVAAPCNVTSCLHFRLYNGGNFDTGATLSSVPVSGGTSFGVANTAAGYIVYNDASGFELSRVPHTYNGVQQTVLINATNNISGLAATDSFLYGVFQTNVVKRWLPTNLTSITNFTTTFTGTSLTGPAIDEAASAMYIGQVSAGLSPNAVHKVSLTNPALAPLATIALGNTDFPVNIAIDVPNNKIYVGLAVGGTTAQIKRYNRTTLALEQTYNGPTTANGINSYQYNFRTQQAYISMLGGGGDINAINQVSLCTLQ